MRLSEKSSHPEYNGAMIGHYVLGHQRRRPGVNVFACRARSISPTTLVVAAPVIGEVGDWVTASFGPFGTLHGRIGRYVTDGFAVDIEAPATERAALAAIIDRLQHRMWSGEADKRGEPRFLPGEPRSVIVLADGTVMPCLVVDYSASGAAVSADVNPPIGAPVTIGEVAGRVVRQFEVGFAVAFDALQDAEAIEQLLEAPEEWHEAVSVLKAAPVDTADPSDDPDPTGYQY
ncbi:MAG TPA: PilZ domain-containing protein [Devosia sp.]|nr:PilZ domain-containing protein [Devosia sp.]